MQIVSYEPAIQIHIIQSVGRAGELSQFVVEASLKWGLESNISN